MIRAISITRLLFLLPFVALLYNPSPALANSFLGSAASFTVLAGSLVMCQDSEVTGDVGAGVIVNQNICTISGTVHQGDEAAAEAYRDFLRAYAALALPLVPCTQTLTGTLAGVTLTPGLYCFDAAAALTGTLTLKGPANGIWIFKIGTGSTGALTGTNFSVVMAGGGQACNVYWRAAQAATLTTSNFQGTVLAGADITVTGGTLNGDVLAGGAGSTSVPTGAVTLTNAVVAGCDPTAGVPPGVPPDGDKCDSEDGDDDDEDGDDEDWHDDDRGKGKGKGRGKGRGKGHGQGQGHEDNNRKGKG